MDRSLQMWLWLIEYMASDRDVPFSALFDIIGNIPYALDEFPSYIREGLALRGLEEFAGKACGETPPAAATKTATTSAYAGKIDATQTCVEVLSKVVAANDPGMAKASFSRVDLQQFVLLKRESHKKPFISMMLQKISESSQPNVSCSIECNNLPEVSSIPTMKHTSPRTKDPYLLRKFKELNPAKTPFESVGGGSQNDFNILQNLAEQNSLDVIQTQKTTGINLEEDIEVPETPIHLNSENGIEHGSNQVTEDRQPVNNLGITDYSYLSSYASHERNGNVCVNNDTCEISKNHLQAEERKNLLTSDTDIELISLERNTISVLNNEGGCDHSAKRKDLSSKISVRFAKRNRREKADRDDNYHGVKENKRTDRSSLKGLRKRRNRQTLWTPIKRPSRRTKLIWKTEEEEILEKAMQKIPQNDDGSTSWVKILEYCRPVLDESRTPIDLKDKWRNIQKREAKNRG